MDIKLSLGIDNFEKLRSSGCYYIDKTGFIKELLDDTFEINLITRPRRFGKTLAMSMLADFFDIQKDSANIFEGLEISKHEDLCKKWRNQWPVLFLSLKDINGRNFSSAYGMLGNELAKICKAHAYLAKSPMVDPDDIKIFLNLKANVGSETEIKCSLDTLMRMMAAHYGKEVILLIDEYDVPLSKANDNHYYEEMLDVIRSMMSIAWKTNPWLKFAVITGCLRIAKESIFTGANNFIVNSVSGYRYRSYFGFQEHEVKMLLADCGLSEHFEEMKKWYDGYVFSGTEIYCPWDVLNHVNQLLRYPEAKPACYWRDTSHNDIIRGFIDKENIDIGDKFETLLSGGIVSERIAEDLTYTETHSSEENLWSILYLTGYLTEAAPAYWPKSFCPEEGKTVLRIPNEEVKTIFADTIAKWFQDTMVKMDRRPLFHAWWNGESENLTEMLEDLLFDTISYFDYREDYYHAFLAGLFVGAGYEVLSNSEQGTGRADVVVKDRKNRRALLIEVKRSKSEKGMAADCEKALCQIDRKHYTRKLLKGYKCILCYGAAFFEKSCIIKVEARQE